MPIYFNEEVIGAIGIGGDEEVIKYTEIVKSMTEILIREAYLNISIFQNREKNRLIIETLLLDEPHLTKETFFRIDFNENYRVAVGSLHTDTYDLTYLYKTFDALLINTDDVFYTISHSLIIFLAKEHLLSELLPRLCKSVLKKHQVKLQFGIGTVGPTGEKVKYSFEAAKQTLSWLKMQKLETPFMNFEEIGIGFLIVSLPEKTQLLFKQNILSSLSPKELTHAAKIFQAFTKHNGSLQKCADELFIHKNTLQYQLNKIEKLTGYDPRNYEDFTTLHMAFLLHKQTQEIPDY